VRGYRVEGCHVGLYVQGCEAVQGRRVLRWFVGTGM